MSRAKTLRLAGVLFGCLFCAGSAARAETAAWTAEIARLRSAGASRAVAPAEDAAGAVDGVANGAFSFHTSQDENPFWQVDLGAVESIGRVVVYNTGHVPERAAQLKLLLSDDGSTWQQVYQHDGTPFVGATDDKPLVVPLDQASGRFVRIQLPGSTWLHLDEVQVFGDGEINLALRKPATQSSVSQWSTRSIRIEPEREEGDDDLPLARRALQPVLNQLGAMDSGMREEFDVLVDEAPGLDDPRWAVLYSRATAMRQRIRAARDAVERFSPRAMRMAIEDMARSFPERFDAAAELERLAKIEARLPQLRQALPAGEPAALDEAQQLVSFQRDVLLANPLLDFDQLLVLRRNLGGQARGAMGDAIGLAANFHANDAVAAFGWDNQIARLSSLRDQPQLDTLFQPDGGRIVADLVLDFDAQRLMFASIGTAQQAWRIFEIGIDGQGLVQVTPDDGADISHSDPCYLPDGRVIFASTASYVGLPCVFGSAPMVCLYRLDRQSGEIRQLTFEQDSDWSPTVTNSGRVMYQRWEYADLPHSNSRFLFHMNPDGTGQIEYFGSGSYFPPSFFYARPIPNHPSKIAGIVTGHHGTHRSGRLLLVEPARGRYEAEGVVQEIPGWGKPVEPIVADRIVDGVWPQFLQPYPLSDKYFLVSMKGSPDSLWGIYLVDVFDNITLVKEVEGAALLQPIPVQARPRPPVIVDRVDLQRDDAVVMVDDVYHGPGLKDIPRGEVKQLRVISYYWSSRGMGGLLGSIGMDGPWDIKRVLGTVPVEEDGSAAFTIPANKPITLQPLDADGRALQLKRTWIVGMPGEVVSCVGCHDSQNTVPPAGRASLASLRPPSQIEPWYGPPRGFAFHREVQPVLDRNCVGCHDGQPREDGMPLIDLRGTEKITDWSSQISGNVGYRLSQGGAFSVSYAHLHRYVRRPGIESDMRLLTPGEFHADTTELIQMLRDGRHHGVTLSGEEWDRLITWIDLNAPYHGTWSEMVGREAVERVMPRRMELSRKYAGIEVDYEAIYEPDREPIEPLVPRAPDRPMTAVQIAGWPFDAEQARRRQGPEPAARRTIDLGDGLELALVYVPAGEFALGRADGDASEGPSRRAVVRQPFWMGQFEVTNAQFARFDPEHDSRLESRHGYQFGRLGYPLNEPEQPVVRVSWHQAMDFCRWLSERTGLVFTLPTEEQWEWACRAGTGGPFHFGDLDADFSPYANLGDIRLREYAACTARGGYTRAEVIDNAGPYDDWVPRDTRYDDGHFLAAPVGSYKPNAWSLHDMHGNVWEWTRSATGESRKIVRGGSWRDRPHRATSSFRLDYRPYHQVFNVGFRVIAEGEGVQLGMADN